MYTKFTFTDNDANVVDFLMTVGSSAYIGLKDVQYALTGDVPARPKAEANSSWPVFVYYQYLLINVEADIVAQTPTDFMTLKQSALQILLPDPVNAQTVRLHGTVTIRLAGKTEDYEIPVVVSPAPTIPQNALTPCSAPMQLGFHAFRPYFHGVTSNNYYWVL